MTSVLACVLAGLASFVQEAADPVIEGIHPAKTGPGALVKIVGHRLSRKGAQTWILLSPDLWIEAEEATETEIVLRIPIGAESGPLRLRVGADAAEPRPLQIVQDFRLAPPLEAVVRDKDGFAVTTTSDLLVRLKDFRGHTEAEALARKHGASIAGVHARLNLFTLRFKTGTLPELFEIEKILEKDESVESVTIPLGLRPR